MTTDGETERMCVLLTPAPATLTRSQALLENQENGLATLAKIPVCAVSAVFVRKECVA